MLGFDGAAPVSALQAVECNKPRGPGRGGQCLGTRGSGLPSRGAAW
jgi:hypothetical protein